MLLGFALRGVEDVLKPGRGNLVLSIALLWAVVFEGASLVELIFYPTPANGQRTVADLDHGLYLVLAPLSPALLVSILYSRWIWVALSFVIRRSSSVRLAVQRFRDELGSLCRSFGVSTAGQSGFGLNSRLFLCVALVLAAFVAYFPYRVDLNPNV